MLLPRDYNMVFWSYEPKNGVELLSQVNSYMRELGKDYMPVFLAGEEISLEPDSLENTLGSWRSDSGLLATGLTSKNDIALRMTVGAPVRRNIRKPEVLSLGFKNEQITGETPLLDFEQLQKLFVFCLELFRPFYAYFSKSGEININPRYREAFYAVDSDKVPIAIEWFNYFDPGMVQRLGGTEKILSAPGYHKSIVRALGGVLLILQRHPFDYNNAEDLDRRLLVETFLDLDSKRAKYQR